MNVYYVPYIMLGSEDIKVNKTRHGQVSASLFWTFPFNTLPRILIKSNGFSVACRWSCRLNALSRATYPFRTKESGRQRREKLVSYMEEYWK